jgi:hypothetical protein
MALKSARAEEARPDQEALAGLNPAGSALARVDTSAVALGEFSGDTDDIQIRLPFLQVASGQGKLDGFVKGSLILGSENLIAGPGERVLITLLGVQPFFKEYLSGDAWDADATPRTFLTKAEVIANGGTVEWVNGAPPSFKRAGVIRALVRQPDKVVCGLFGVPIGDAKYAPVQWGVDKSAAQTVLPIIKRDTSFALKERGMLSGIFELWTSVMKFSNGHSTYVPNLKLVGFHTDAEIAEIKSLFAVATPVSEEAGVPVTM